MKKHLDSIERMFYDRNTISIKGGATVKRGGQAAANEERLLLKRYENDIKYITDQIKSMTPDQVKRFTDFLSKEINLKRRVRP